MAEMTVSDGVLNALVEINADDSDVCMMARELIRLREAARREPVAWMYERRGFGKCVSMNRDVANDAHKWTETPLIPQPASEGQK